MSEGYIDVPSDRVWYQAAIVALYREHFCRLDPWPACVERLKADQRATVRSTAAVPQLNGPHRPGLVEQTHRTQETRRK